MSRFFPWGHDDEHGDDGDVDAVLCLLLTRRTIWSPLGAILTVIGFSAFGNHWRNSLPVMIGVVLATKVGLTSDVSTFSLLLTAIFGTSLAPISGYYGPVAGVIAGVVHAALVTNITYLHGGLNLYNNGFSSGFVAATMVPLLDEYQQIRRRRRK